MSHELGGTTHEDPIEYLAGWGKTWDDVVNDVTYLYNCYQNPAAPVAATPAISADDANYIINRWLVPEYDLASDADKLKRHELANALRRASGQKEE